MAAEKFSKALVEQVFALNGQQKTAAEIAQILNIKKLQVSAILAHRGMKMANASQVAQVEEASGLPSSGYGVAEGHEVRIPTEVETSFAAGNVLTAEEANASDENFGQDGLSGIYVGDDLEYGDPIYWEPLESQAVQNPHLMIIGESGSGKTYASQCLVAELSQQHIPSIIFDYGQSFELHTLDKTFKDYTPLREHLIGEHGLGINPLQIFPRDIHGPKSVATRVADVFDAVYRLGDIQRKVVIDAILLAFEKAGVCDSDRDTWPKEPPNMLMLQQVLEELSSNREYPNYKNAVGVAARLTTFFMLSSFRSDDKSWSWQSLIDNPEREVNILQFRGLEGKTQRVTVELLLWHLFFYLKSHGQGHLRIYCVLDEAHHLSFREGGPIDSLLREARKFGLGIIFASQQPEDFSPAAYSNTASKLVFQTSDPNFKISRFLSAKCANYSSPEEVSQTISVLKQGQAFFISKNKGHILSVADLKKRGTQWLQKK
jgi:DNA phosphorothioation-dependent restriction protein DptH